MPETGDETSLRSLYLILRWGFPLIIGLSSLAAVVAFSVASVRPERFRAQATVQILPSPIRYTPYLSLLQGPGDPSIETYVGLRGHLRRRFSLYARGDRAGPW